MNHPYIEQNEILERYLRQELGGEDLELFEDHILTCEKCLAELEAEERFGQGLRSLAEREDLPAPTPWQRKMVPYAWAASLVIALLPAWVVHQDRQWANQRLLEQESISEAEKEASVAREAALLAQIDALRGDLEEASSGLSKEAEVASDQEAEQLRRQLAGARQQLQQLTRPRGDVAILRLEAVRSAAEKQAAHLVTLTEEPEWLVLLLELDVDEELGVVIEGPEGQEVWRQDNLRLDGYGQLALQLHSSMLPAGYYRIVVTESTGPGRFESSLEIRR